MGQDEFELLKQLYETKEGRVSPTDERFISDIESELSVTLPHDFKTICEFFSGGLIGGFAINSLSTHQGKNSIISDTLMLRKFGNPHDCIVLANDECGMLYLLTDNSVPAVYHTGRMPLPNALENGEVEMTWPSFFHFFRQSVGS